MTLPADFIGYTRRSSATRAAKAAGSSEVAQLSNGRWSVPVGDGTYRVPYGSVADPGATVEPLKRPSRRKTTTIAFSIDHGRAQWIVENVKGTRSRWFRRLVDQEIEAREGVARETDNP